MAITSRKISSFPQLTSLSGEEYLMVAYKGKSYKIPVSMLTGNAIQSLTQKVNNGDGADNPIAMTVGTGDDAIVYNLHVYNGQRGSQGPDGKMGPKGPTGDTAVALYNQDIEDLIYDSLDENEELDLSQFILSAAQGVELNAQLELLKEEFLTQVEYDDKAARNELDPNVKYFIWEE